MPQTLVDLVLQQGARSADVGYTFLGDGDRSPRELTYAQLARRARAIAARLTSMGLAGSRVLLIYAAGLEFIEAFCGCLLAGTIAVPVYPPRVRHQRTMSRYLSIVQDCKPAAILTSSAMLGLKASASAEWASFSEMPWLATDHVSTDEAEIWRRPAISGDTTALLQYTSGSTSTPKGVIVSHHNLVTNLECIRSDFGIGTDDRWVSWLPHYHDMGLIGGILDPLFAGIPAILFSPVAFLQRPERWLEAITRYRGTVSGGPSFGYDLLASRKISEEEYERLDLSSWAVAFNGAEPVRKDVIDRFTRKFAPRGFRAEAMYPCYGLAEATLIVTGGRRAELPVSLAVDAAALEQGRVETVIEPGARSTMLVSSGLARGEPEPIIVDPKTRRRCAAEEVGEVWVRGASVAQGYWQRPDDTQQTFLARLEPTGEGPFLRTGDLGVTRGGRLFITGRSKNLIIVNGRNLYPHDLERTVELSHPSVRTGGAAAFSIDADTAEQIAVVAEVREDGEAYEGVVAAITDALWAEHDVSVHSIALLPPGGLFKTSSGKVQRSLLKQALLERTLEYVHLDQRAPNPSQNIENTSLYRERPKSLDARKTKYRFDIEDISWDKVGSAGLFAGDTLLRALGLVDSVSARGTDSYDFFQWSYAVALCDHFIFLEKEVIRFAQEEKAALSASRSMVLFVEEEDKHMEMFLRFKAHLCARRPEAAARLAHLSEEWGRGYAWKTPGAHRRNAEYEGRLGPRVSHYFWWLGALIFEEYTITLASALTADASAIQPTWLDMHVMHAQEERQHLATDLGYLRALQLSGEERWGWSAVFLAHLLGNLSGFKAFEPVWRICSETYPEEKSFATTLLAVQNERNMWRSMLELFRESKLFPRTERFLPALDFFLEHASWVESVVWGDLGGAEILRPPADQEARFLQWLARSPFRVAIDRSGSQETAAASVSQPGALDAAVVEGWLLGWLRDAVDQPTVDVKRSFASYGLTSIQAVELAGSLGDFVGRPLETTIAWRCPSIEKLVAYLCPTGDAAPADPAPTEASDLDAIADADLHAALEQELELARKELA